MITYFDTSAAMKLLVAEEGSVVAIALWDEAAVVLGSRLLYPELRAALGRAHRAGRITAAKLAEAKEILVDRMADVDIVEVDERLALAAGELAERLRLRAYDAVHLASALQVDGTTLATWDGDLIRAAAATGLPVATSRS